MKSHYLLGLGIIMLVNTVAIGQNQVPAEMGIQPADSVTTNSLADSLSFSRPDYSYETHGKRDPFRSLVPETIDDENTIKTLFEYEEATVMGIVSSESDIYALVNDRAEKSFVLRVGDRVLGGYVTDITGNAVYLHIVKYGRAMNIIMRMESSRYTVIEEDEGFVSIKKPGINLEYESGPLSAKGVIIEEVTVPEVGVVTVEEEWFGRRDPIYDQLMTSEVYRELTDSANVVLIDPQRESWIRLPYIMDWTGPDNVVTFTLIIDDTQDFSSPLVTDENIMTSSYMLNDDLGLPRNTALYWQVIGIDEIGTQFESTPTIMSFKITGQ